MQQRVFYLDLLNPHPPNWSKQVQTHGQVSRAYDRPSKSHVLSLSSTGQVEIPSTAKTTLGLIQPFLVLQVFLLKGCEWTVEIVYVNYANERKRVVFCQCKAKSGHLNYVRLPTGLFKREIWLNLCFDLPALAEVCFPGSAYKHLDRVRVAAVCKLRRIFTMKRKWTDTNGENNCDFLPSAFEFPIGLKYTSQYVGANSATPHNQNKSLSYSPPKSLNPSRARPRPLLKALFRPSEHLKLPSLINRISNLSSPRRVHFLQVSNPSRDISFRSAFPSRSIDFSESPIASEAEDEKSPEPYPGDTFEDESPGLPDVLIPLLQATLNVPHFTPPFGNVVTEEIHRGSYGR